MPWALVHVKYTILAAQFNVRIYECVYGTAVYIIISPLDVKMYAAGTSGGSKTCGYYENALYDLTLTRKSNYSSS